MKIYSLKSKAKKWMDLNKFDTLQFNCGHILAENEKYLILFGGRTQGTHSWTSKYSNVINILDLTDIDKSLGVSKATIREARIKCPPADKGSEHKFVAFRVNNRILSEIVIYGFYRTCWRQDNFIPVLPIEIMQFISSMDNNDDWVHLISKNKGTHWKKEMKHILGS